jgi:Ribbon-helix-helix protein, copG family
MIRTQVQLTEEQLGKLRRLSAESGQSVAELVRLGVELYLQSKAKPDLDELRKRAKRAVGGFRSGFTDIGRNHDAYLAEDFL